MIIRLALVTLITLATGCSIIESDAGKARYIYTVTTPDGTVHKIDLQNAKNIGLVSATVRYGDIEVELLEQGVDSSGPIKAMVEQNTLLMNSLLAVTP